jgi:hypothetical protein
MHEYVKSKSLDRKSDSDAWASYSKWNEIISSHFFSEKYENRPVYLDLSELWDGFSEKLNLSVSDTVDDFKNSIIKTLNETSVFDEHRNNALRWKKRKEEETPPFVALLAFFSYVAGKMVSDDDYSANNYYGRLQDELKLADDDLDSLTRSYREVCVFFWAWLNDWITSWDGQIGLPTAKALDSKVYVSTAISQALVREQDRNRLKRIFMENALDPGQRLGKMEMLSVLLHWSSSIGGGSYLSRMIQRGGDIREKVSEIACSELMAWDGRLPHGATAETTAHAARIFYIASYKNYPKNKISLYLCTNDTQENECSHELTHEASEEARIAFKGYEKQITLNYLNDFGVSVLEPSEKISHGDALLSKLKIKNKKNNRLSERNGQPICVMVYRLEIGAYQEVSRVVIGTPSIILVHQSILGKVSDVLNLIARPGYTALDSTQIKGLPERWALILNVQILKSIEIEGLESLSPLIDGSVSLVGGLYLGNETWLKSLPPEIVVSLDTDKEVSVELIQELDFGFKFSKTKFEPGMGVQFINLNELHLPDGDYQVSIYEDGSKSKTQASNFKIRSGSSVRMYRRSNSSKLAYVLSPPNSINTISAAKNLVQPEDKVLLTGCFISAPSELSDSFMKMNIRDEFNALKTHENPDEYERTSFTKTTTLDAGSCVLRGYHHVDLDYIPPRASRGFLVRGKCQNCSLTFWRKKGGSGASSNKKNIDKQVKSAPLNSANAINLKAVAPGDDGLNRDRPTYRQIYDALCYLKEGSFERLSGIVRSKDDEAWAPYEVLRKLVGLGHLDLELDQNTLKPRAWRISDPALVLTGDNKFTVTGWSSEKFIDQLSEVSSSLGGELRIIEPIDRFPIVEILGIDSNNIDIFADIVSAVSSFPIACTKNFTKKLLSSIPSLSNLTNYLPQVELPEDDLHFFDPEDMKWKKVASEIKRGAYRHDLNGVKYFYLPNDFIKSSKAFLCDARLAKYFALSKEYWRFFKYNQGTKILQVPIGMELPFLFDRVAISCSGSMPDKENGLVVYTQIDRDIAEGLAFKLFNESI